MKTKILFVSVLALVLSVSSSFAGEEGMPMDTEKAAKMAEMQKYMMPNENHKALEPLAGTWKAQVKWWMSAEGKPEASQGTSENRWIMGGRFLEQDYKGESMGKPFEGMGITGYDTIRGEYTSIWLDSMATGIMVATAQFDPASQTLNQNGTMSCPLTMEKNRPIRTIWKITDADHNIYESYMNDKDGKEFKTLEISYERAK